MPKGVLVIAGPTATGKTALGAALAGYYGGEVVSADAMQLYRGMVIGTAAPTAEEQKGIPHHMVGVVSPNEAYSVGRYVQEAGVCVEDILSRGKLPILVGGTNLYIEALLRGLEFADGNDEIRSRLEAEYDALGGEALLNRLRDCDAERAALLHANDKKRIVRALEIFEISGETISEHDRRTKERPPKYESLKIALSFEDRAELYRRIDRRVDGMLEKGLVSEVEALLAGGTAPESTAMQAIGYKEIAAALRGECTLAEAVEAVKQASRRYAKRQLSWLRRDRNIHWIMQKNMPDFQEAFLISTKLLENSVIL